MFRNAFRFGAQKLHADNEDEKIRHDDDQRRERLRSLATSAALSATFDASPAMVVGIYDYARRGCGGKGRSA